MALSHESLESHSLPEAFVPKDAFYFQAEDMALRIGVEVTPRQVKLYRELREEPMNGEPLKSDQKIMAVVLEQTGGPVEIFKQSYPNIFPPEVVKES